MAKEPDSKYILINKSPEGSIKIAEDVINVIAGIAAMEVDGVEAMAGNMTNSLMGRAGVRKSSKGVRVFLSDTNDSVRIDVAIIVAYGYTIPSVSSKVQDRVKTTVENMTSLKVSDVNVRVALVGGNDTK